MWAIDAVLYSIRERLESRHVPAQAIEAHLEYHGAVLTRLQNRYINAYPSVSFKGMGGSGMVILVTPEPSALGSGDKCIKYPQPTIGMDNPISLAAVLDNEARSLTQLHHQHIIPVDDVGSLDLTDVATLAENDRTVPYYMMPAIDSVELGDYARDNHASLDELVLLLHQVSTAIAYMHSQGFVHLDIKPENIFVVRNHRSEATALLADFGFCKSISVPSDDLTLVMGTFDYIHPDLFAAMKHPTKTNPTRIRDTVEKRVLDYRFDRFAFGLTIINALIAFLKTEAGRARAIDVGTLRGLQLIALRCSDGHAGRYRVREDQERVLPALLFRPEIAHALKYQAADDTSRDLEILVRQFQGVSVEPEISGLAADIVCLPPRTFASLSARVVKALDSAMIRRLTGLSQLALCAHVYPGATHSRKEHMLGTYQTVANLMRYMLSDTRNPLASFLLDARRQRLILLSALMHDISHVPLLHELEDVLPDLDQIRYSSEILDGRWGDAEFQEELDQVLIAWDLTREELVTTVGSLDFVSKDGRCDVTLLAALAKDPRYELARSLNDGAVDADKIDYLQRDALHVGVQYGHGVDVERLQRRATVALWSESSGSSWKTRCRLGAWKSGQAAMEAVIAVRHSMYAQVYAHRTVRAARAMLNYVVSCWRCADGQRLLTETEAADVVFGFMSQLVPQTQNPGLFADATDEWQTFPRRLRDNLPFAEATAIRWFARASKDPIAIEMAEHLIQRRLYKEVSILAEGDCPEFIRLAFQKGSRGQARYKRRAEFGAAEFVALSASLDSNLRTFLEGKAPSAIHDSTPAKCPLALVDVAIPKTMRSQQELVVVSDEVANHLSWRRLERMSDREGRGAMLGLSVETSPVFEMFGGRSGDSMAEIAVRVFVRQDLAPVARVHLDKGTVANWLNSYRPA